jgi:hypothetical protein
LVVDRAQFTAIFDQIFKYSGGITDNHVLWEAEKCYNIKCTQFACVPPVKIKTDKSDDYWNWCNSTLKGKVMCFSSNDDNSQEWWGFTEKEDILVWMIRWI